MSIRVFAINPGSTSTKIALFEDDICLFSKNVMNEFFGAHVLENVFCQ